MIPAQLKHEYEFPVESTRLRSLTEAHQPDPTLESFIVGAYELIRDTHLHNRLTCSEWDELAEKWGEEARALVTTRIQEWRGK